MVYKYCFIIVGPTATGKSRFAIDLGDYFKTQIISADSRQCYKELNIGVAKPSLHDLEKIPHYFINSHSIQDEVNAKTFEAYANHAANLVFSKQDVAVMVGGTGLYINAFCNGLDEIPAISNSIREGVLSEFKKHGLPWLQKEIEKHDPEYFAKGELKNPQRLIRALEVKLSTGMSITQYQQHQAVRKPYNLIKIGLELPKDQLHQNIHTRVDAMMEEGLLNEVRDLLPYQHLKALNTVGYTELFPCLTGKVTLQKSIETIKLNTRRYAKRQLTWFKRDQEVTWLPATTQSATIIDVCKRLINY